ncbi:hypothetical protein GCK72_011354 [Caenorhabditis remanei]|uniref:Uncharacterized protein n=1 Tax=Caenorhabditis remanei TaxID=31234 RepID=A0A6A5H7R8_CAERE|nr:hypothetical protein GCK72_011354 [Caenorhabditis remanei]KAF1763089.1 hypothetical protein GCK72_011354 [Caenorhabditis remanei]
MDKKRNTKKIWRLRRDLMIGYGGMAGCAVAVLLVTVTLVKQEWRHIQSLTFLCTFMSDLFFCLFSMNLLQEYKIKNGKHLKAIILRLIILFLHAVLAGILLTFVHSIDRFENVKFSIRGHAIVFSVCTAELAVVGMDWVVLKDAECQKNVELVNRSCLRSKSPSSETTNTDSDFASDSEKLEISTV